MVDLDVPDVSVCVFAQHMLNLGVVGKANLRHGLPLERLARGLEQGLGVDARADVDDLRARGLPKPLADNSGVAQCAKEVVCVSPEGLHLAVGGDMEALAPHAHRRCVAVGARRHTPHCLGHPRVQRLDLCDLNAGQGRQARGRTAHLAALVLQVCAEADPQAPARMHILGEQVHQGIARHHGRWENNDAVALRQRFGAPHRHGPLGGDDVHGRALPPEGPVEAMGLRFEVELDRLRLRLPSENVLHVVDQSDLCLHGLEPELLVLLRKLVNVLRFLPLAPGPPWSRVVQNAIAELLLTECGGPVAKEVEACRPVQQRGRCPSAHLPRSRSVADDVVALGADELLGHHPAALVRAGPAADRIQGKRHAGRLGCCHRATPNRVVVVGRHVHLLEQVVVVHGFSPEATGSIRCDAALHILIVQDIDLRVCVRGDAVPTEAAEVQQHAWALVAAEVLVRPCRAAGDRPTRQWDLVEVVVRDTPECRAPILVQLPDIRLVPPREPHPPRHRRLGREIQVAALMAQLVVHLPECDAIPLGVSLRQLPDDAVHIALVRRRVERVLPAASKRRRGAGVALRRVGALEEDLWMLRVQPRRHRCSGCAQHDFQLELLGQADDHVEQREIEPARFWFQLVPHELTYSDEVRPQVLLDGLHVVAHVLHRPLLGVVIDAHDDPAAAPL
mmetsp:Transcript_96137/g.310090  ORF Transcript_96137/g.310090 Transcript_96137/m.310090 type:complete len:676 (-) Transcript_96137:125-2152(-)